MKGGPAPLRFLGLVLGGWIGLRAAMLVPDWAGDAVSVDTLPPMAAASPQSGANASHRFAALVISPDAEQQPARHFSMGMAPARGGPIPRRTATAVPHWKSGRTVQPELAAPPAPIVAAPFFASPITLPMREERAPEFAHLMPAPLSPTAPGLGHWSLSAWTFVRRGSEAQLAAGGQLGGSQAGARVLFRLTEQVALSGRVSTPLRRARGTEAALGIEVQPVRSLPVRILVERRQAIGEDGRSAFALLAYGGVSDRPVFGPLLLDAYAQAGMVGVESRAAFADGAVRLSLPVTERLSVGAGAWGAAQPGVARLDVGPQSSYRLPIGRGARISAEWRVRVSGDARPGSGPALTLATDF